MNFRLILSAIIFSTLLLSCTIAPIPSNGNKTVTDPGNPPPDLIGIFVTPAGNDTNAGTNKTMPVLTLQVAFSNAAVLGFTNIYVAQGSYVPGIGLNATARGIVVTNSGIALSGGWDTNFVAASGYSVLDGTGGLYHVFFAANVSNVTVQGFLIQNGTANGGGTIDNYGGGMFLTNIKQCLLTNIIVSNNSSYRNGGGIWINGVSNAFYATVLNNQCDTGTYYGNGGGICVASNSFYNSFNGEISYNSATYGGGIFFDTNSAFNFVSGNIQYNTAYTPYQGGGGGIALYSSSSNQFSVLINANSAQNGNCYGGGMFIIGDGNKINGTVSGNGAFEGGGLVFYRGSGNIVVANFFSNGAGNLGGAVYVEYAGVTISGLIVLNSAGYAGGGIFNYWGSVILTNAAVVNNHCTYSYGGGLSDQNTVSVTNGSSIYNNTPNDYYKF